MDQIFYNNSFFFPSIFFYISLFLHLLVFHLTYYFTDENSNVPVVGLMTYDLTYLHFTSRYIYLYIAFSYMLFRYLFYKIIRRG